MVTWSITNSCNWIVSIAAVDFILDYIAWISWKLVFLVIQDCFCDTFHFQLQYIDELFTFILSKWLQGDRWNMFVYELTKIQVTPLNSTKF